MRCFSQKITVKVYNLAVIIMTLKVMLDRLVYFDNHGLLDNSLIVMGVGLLLVSFIFETRHTLLEYIVIGILGILCLYACLNMGEFYLIMSFFLIIASINKDLKKTVRLMRNVQLTIVAISVVWYLFAWFVLQDTIYIVEKSGRIAHHFGFSHPNSFALIVGWICLQSLYLSYGRYQNRIYVWYPLVGVVLYYFTCCDTVMYIMFAATLLLAVARVRAFQAPIHMLAKYIFPLIAAGNVFCLMTYCKRGGFLYQAVYALDKLLTARIKQAAYIVENYGATFWGHKVPMGEDIAYDSYYRLSYIMCDGLYSYLFVCAGFVFTIIISFAIWNCVRRKKEYSIIVIIYAVYGILETHGLNAFMVYPLLIFGAECLTQLHHKLEARCAEEIRRS